MKFIIFKSFFIMSTPKLVYGLGKLIKSKRSNTVDEAPGVLYHKIDKIAYLPMTPSVAL